MYKKIIVNSLYLIIWIIPFFVFCIYNIHVDSILKALNTHTLNVVKFTFLQAFISSILALLISLIPANYISKSNSFLSTLAGSSLFIPFFFPSVSTVISFSILCNMPGIKNLHILYSIYIIVIANVFYNSPIFVKYIGDALRNISPSIVEVATIDGANKVKLFLKIKLPLVLPAIFRAFFICFAYSFTNFAIIIGLGGIKFSTLEVEIATTLNSSPNLSKALVYGVIQLIILSLLSLGTILSPTYSASYGERNDSRTTFFSKCFTTFYVCFEYLVVISGIVFAFYNFYTDRFDFKDISILFSAKLNTFYPVISSIINSFIISFMTSILVLFLVYLLLKCHSKITDWIVLSSCGISSAFLGITLIYMNIRYDIAYPVLIICGYIIIASPIAYSYMYHHIKSFPSDLIDAARVDGANKFQTLKYIELPILYPVFITVFIQVFAIAFGEFTIAYTMQLINYFPTIPVVQYALLDSRKMMESSLLNGISILIVIALFIFSEAIKRKIEKNI